MAVGEVVTALGIGPGAMHGEILDRCHSVPPLIVEHLAEIS
jgi:hypothetical protein